MNRIQKFLSPLLLLAALAIPAASAQTERMAPTTDAASVTVRHATPKPSASPQKKSAAIPFNGNGGKDRPNIVVLTVHHKSGRIETRRQHNSRVDAGANAIALQIGSTGGVSFPYVALSTSVAAVVKTDTTCPSEISTSGLGRAIATYGGYTAPASLGASATYTQTESWTASGTQTIGKICALSAVSAGTLGFETLLGSTITVNSGDIVSLVWTFTL